MFNPKWSVILQQLLITRLPYSGLALYAPSVMVYSHTVGNSSIRRKWTPGKLMPTCEIVPIRYKHRSSRFSHGNKSGACRKYSFIESKFDIKRLN